VRHQSPSGSIGRATGAIPKKPAVIVPPNSSGSPVLKSVPTSLSGAVRNDRDDAVRKSSSSGEAGGAEDQTPDEVSDISNGGGPVAEEEDAAGRRNHQLKGLKEFAQKYLSDNNARVGHQPAAPAAADSEPTTAPLAAVGGGDGESEEKEVRGAEALPLDSDTEDLESGSMPPTIRDGGSGRVYHHQPPNCRDIQLITTVIRPGLLPSGFNSTFAASIPPPPIC
jgi:hypothetical protein